MSKGGWGFSPWGKSNFGNANAKYEPRFQDSDPVDAATTTEGNVIVWFQLYCFSNYVGEAENLYVEISEDDGVSYNDAFVDGSYVFPYDDTHSRILRLDGHTMKVYIHKKSFWAVDDTIKVRVTALDAQGNAATKVTPVTWS